jgi:hypothetical protein
MARGELAEVRSRLVHARSRRAVGTGNRTSPAQAFAVTTALLKSRLPDLKKWSKLLENVTR